MAYNTLRNLSAAFNDPTDMRPLPLNSHDPFCKPEPLPSENLSPITIRELTLDHYHEGRILHGRLDEDAYVFGRGFVITVLVDEHGKAARLTLRNSVNLSSCFGFGNMDDDVAKMYPRGAFVSIKEPCMVSNVTIPDVAVTHSKSLWVPNPATITVTSHHSTMTMGDLKEAGNDDFRRGRYRVAAEAYTRCLEDCKDDELKGVLLSNRAECYLKECRYEDALRDVDAASMLLPNHAKSWYRKGRALEALKDYSGAAASFSRADQLLDHSSEDVQSCYQRASTFASDSEHGTIDVIEYFNPGMYFDKFPECIAGGPKLAEFVGPVTIDMASDGRGRGLFTTSNVNAGDLLMVCNALVVSHLHESEDVLEDLVTMVVTACLKNPKTLLPQVYSMVDEGVVPSMELFRPGSDQALTDQAPLPMDVIKIEKAVHGLLDRQWERCKPFWTLPWFVNHSCLPNATFHYAGDALCCFAARAMEAGTELVRAYYKSPAAGEFRIPPGNYWSCSCVRCKLEKRLFSVLGLVAGKQQRFIVAMDSSRAGPEDKEVVRLASEVMVEVENVLGTLGEEEKEWLLAAYSMSYTVIGCQEYGSASRARARARARFLDVARAIHNTMPGCCFRLIFTLYVLVPSGVEKKALAQLLAEDLVAAIGNNPSCVLRALRKHGVEDDDLPYGLKNLRVTARRSQGRRN